MPQNLAVSDIDLCVILGNLIDNAVEACEKVAEPVDVPAVLLHHPVNTLEAMSVIATLGGNIGGVQLPDRLGSGVAHGDVELLLKHADI